MSLPLNDPDAGDPARRKPAEAGVEGPAPAREYPLSEREREVLSLLGVGLDYEEIAAQMHCGVKTVLTHRDNLRIKLRLDGAADVRSYAMSIQNDSALLAGESPPEPQPKPQP